MKSPSEYQILIAEDSSFNIMILERIFSKLDYGYVIVGNGSDAWKELTLKQYDLILMDIEMPVMDGITATRKIREEYGKTGRFIPIIAMTGHLNPEKHKEILNAGINDYLVKPFKTEVLKEKIQIHLAALETAGKQEGKISEVNPGPSQKLVDLNQLKDFQESVTNLATILLCEDDLMLSRTIEFKLKKDGYSILTAENGKIAAEILKKEKVNLIITDLLMPYMGGLELIVLVRKDLNLSLPIMVLSHIGLEKTVVQAFDLGADDYLVKPFSPLELGIRVKKLLS